MMMMMMSFCCWLVAVRINALIQVKGGYKHVEI
jgi:hypothetical protein